MTVCYRTPVAAGTYIIEYDRGAEWHSRWAIFHTRDLTGRRVVRRCATYTEARRVVDRIKLSERIT